VMLDPVAGAREGRRRDGKVDFLDGHVDGVGEERDPMVDRRDVERLPSIPTTIKAAKRKTGMFYVMTSEGWIR
jgi:hypothetical protein